jgi:membrane associated rhomboid family serine protease
MSARTTFRGLLIATVISMAASVGAYFLQRNSLPFELREYLQSRSQQVLSHDYTMLSVMTVACAVLFLVSFVGLYFFWRPARLLFCVFVLVGLFMPLAGFGPDVETGWMELWGSCSSILLGVILCLMFTSPIREQFARKRPTPNTALEPTATAP